MVSSARANAMVFFDHLANLERAMKNGVKIRLVTPEADALFSGELDALAKNPMFDFRFSSNPEISGMFIFDKKVMTLRMSETDRVPSLWSNNRYVLRLAQSFFDNIWNTARNQDEFEMEKAYHDYVSQKHS